MMSPAVNVHPENSNGELSYLRSEIKRLRAALRQKEPALAMLLRHRGFSIYKKEPLDDVLVPADNLLDHYYQMLHKYSFRLFLRDVLKHQEFFTVNQVARYATPDIVQRYLDYLVSAGLVKKQRQGYALARPPIRSFGPTLEWYLAEVFKREFGSEAFWGVKFRGRRVGGDYDVIACIEKSLFYGEVKASPPKHIFDAEIAAFIDRVLDLSPDAAIFLMDTELRMKDKIVPLFEHEMQNRFSSPPPIERLEHELFHIRNRIFILNAKRSIVRNIEQVVRRHFQGTISASLH